jgi:hypothetical protein
MGAFLKMVEENYFWNLLVWASGVPTATQKISDYPKPKHPKLVPSESQRSV